MEEKATWDEKLYEEQGEERVRTVLERIANARIKAIDAGIDEEGCPVGTIEEIETWERRFERVWNEEVSE